ncbi:MAG TPA: hypothetical protein VFM98_06415, partial [Ramlibacter sp.]|uniref:hypothetical protein n=1 Tax=Ramlibacter sp. TaxID=1917967 RepID=UPI002D80B993
MAVSKRRTLVLGLGALFVGTHSGIACAAFSSTSVDAYRNASQRALAECAGAFRNARKSSMFGGADHRWRDCVANKQVEVARIYEEAYASLRAQSTRSALLQAYQRAFEAAVAGIEPLPAESEAAYEQRQSF